MHAIQTRMNALRVPVAAHMSAAGGAAAAAAALPAAADAVPIDQLCLLTPALT